jgi:DNA-binding SARP family transcriptional activator/tetratricopeptide (TPR) repeat protein
MLLLLRRCDGLALGGSFLSGVRENDVVRVVVGEVRVELLGRFRVVSGEREIAEGDWPTRRARELVALLALADGHRLARDRVIEWLWPHLDARAGAANLRKAAHHARRALDDREAVALRAEQVELFPGRRVDVDAARFLRDAERVLGESDPGSCASVAAGCAGALLPDSPYEAWAQEPRRQVQARLCELLRASGQWERLLEVEPTDEASCRELMREAVDAGRRHVAIRLYERLRIAMVRELGTRPNVETRALYDRCTTGVRAGEAVFVGREVELAEAAGVMRSAAGGRTSALLVRGPSGIGKSAFCREVAARGRADGWRVIEVAAGGPGEPYGPLSPLFEQLLVEGRGVLEALPSRSRSILVELTPLAPPAPKVEGALTRHQVVATVQRALAVTAGGVPTMLCVEDAHLLDEATADALHLLVAGGAGELLVALACRSEWIRTSLPHGIAELARGDSTVTVELGPLPGGAVAELVKLTAAVPQPDEAIGRIVELAQGSPFFALELARASTPSSAGVLPGTVRQAVLRRMAGLGDLEIDALAALAIAGDEFELASVLALTGMAEDDAFALLDTALNIGILVVSGARYRFRHELVRHALTDELPGHRRVRLHRDAAQRLAQAGAAPELVAEHWLRGERPGEAAEWLLDAARRAVGVGAFADALGQVERLLADAPAHWDALCLRAEILDALGDGRAAEAYAAAAAAVGDPEAQELHARQALAQLKASDPDSALRTLARVRPRSAAGRLAEALTLSAAAAIGRYADAETAALKAREAHELAVTLGDPGAILDATWAQALAAHAKGDLPARLREYLHRSQDLPELATRLFDGQLCVTERMLFGGLPNDEIIAFAYGLAAEAQRIGAARGEAFAVTLRGEAEILAGQLDAAGRDFAAGAKLHGRIGAVAGEALSLLGSAQVAIRRGRPEQAIPFLTQALLMARESEVGHHTLDRIYGAMVEAATDTGGGVDVVRQAESAIQGPAETCPTCRIAFIVPATIAAARAGDLERARRYGRDCEQALEIVALPPAWHAAVEEARGWLERAGGRPADARKRFRSAADGFRAWGQPLDARRCAELARA